MRGPIAIISLIIVVCAACSSAPAQNATGPRLVGESTLAPSEPALPTASSNGRRTPTFDPAASPPATATQPLEVISPLEQVTVDAGFVLVTPTLPPSKTPTTTITPTVTITPSQPVTPTITVTATATAPAPRWPP